MKPTFYLSDADNLAMEQVAQDLRKQNVQGLYRANGTLNRSALLKVMIKITQNVLKQKKNT